MWYHRLWFSKAIFLTAEVGRRAEKMNIFLPSGLFASSGWHCEIPVCSLDTQTTLKFQVHIATQFGYFWGWRPWPASWHPWTIDPAGPHQIMDCFHVSSSLFSAEYTVINENCPGAEWNIMCRECCEYDQIECICPGQKERVGYTIPCCRNEENECDSCLIHPGMFVAMLFSHQIFGQSIMADAGQGSGEQAHLTEAWDCPAFPQELHLPADSSKTLGNVPPK